MLPIGWLVNKKFHVSKKEEDLADGHFARSVEDSQSNVRRKIHFGFVLGKSKHFWGSIPDILEGNLVF